MWKQNKLIIKSFSLSFFFFFEKEKTLSLICQIKIPWFLILIIFYILFQTGTYLWLIIFLTSFFQGFFFVICVYIKELTNKKKYFVIFCNFYNFPLLWNVWQWHNAWIPFLCFKNLPNLSHFINLLATLLPFLSEKEIPFQFYQHK